MHLGTSAHQSDKLGRGTSSSHTGFGRDATANVVTPFHARRTNGMRTGGGCASTRSTNALPMPQQALGVVLGLPVLRLVLGLFKAPMLVV